MRDENPVVDSGLGEKRSSLPLGATLDLSPMVRIVYGLNPGVELKPTKVLS